MFDPSSTPRLFTVPMGVDFPKSVVDGLTERTRHLPPDSLARIELFVNTHRMQRRIRAMFDAGPARLLPRIRLVAEIGSDIAFSDIPPAVSPLRRRLELSQLVDQLLRKEQTLAPRATLFDLSNSLADLMDEMQGEGVVPDDIAKLNEDDQTGYWARSLQFVKLVQRYFGPEANTPDVEARQRLVIERLVHNWEISPPDHPIIIAGSTGSRGATALLMKAVSKLPQGAVVFPGFDSDLPRPVWDMLDDQPKNFYFPHDHPQYRFRKLMRSLDLDHSDLAQWRGDDAPVNPSRNALISLALRPAPVTDQWMQDGQQLKDLPSATNDMTLLEAPSSRAEAGAIALRLRKAAEDGQTAALISPDRILTRQVTAALDRWSIIPDDSAGEPLPLSATGRFLLQIADILGEVLTTEQLLALLKHPATCKGKGKETRGPHLIWTRELELFLRRTANPFPTTDVLLSWAEKKGGADRVAWASWIGRTICAVDAIDKRSLAEHLKTHLELAEAVAVGLDESGENSLWTGPDGLESRKAVTKLANAADAAGILSATDYRGIFKGVLGQHEVRRTLEPHPNILIWGTLEARVQGAELVILAGLNDGVWPEVARPDPWLNRSMRYQSGLLVPERRIGLSAHDFQQAVAAKEVWLTRSIRSSDSETVPSRWLNRLRNLLAGLGEQGGPAVLDEMTGRGQSWLQQSAQLEEPFASLTAAPRPAPRPPVHHRPKELAVTDVQRLIRDPYSIYAKKILRLRKINPVRPSADALFRGTIIHSVLEQFVRSGVPDDLGHAKAKLLDLAETVIRNEVPWAIAQRLWMSRVEKVSDWFCRNELARRAEGQPVLFEERGERRLVSLDFTLNAKADRIDRLSDGRFAIYDYKTGNPPSKNVQEHFDKQLMLEAAIASSGGFKTIGAAQIAFATYIGLGSSPSEESAPLDKTSPDEIWQNFEDLIASYMKPHQGYMSRRAIDKDSFAGDFDHLARFGEWEEASPPVAEDVS